MVRFPDVNAQLKEFSADALSSPQAIIPGHGFDQRGGLGSHSGLGCCRFEAAPPEPAKCLTMPAEEGVGLNNEERLFPTAGSPCEQHQEHTIGPGTRWALHPTSKDDQRLSEQSVFGNEFS